MLPCNVVVRALPQRDARGDRGPNAMLGVSANSELKPIAAEARERLKRALEALEAES